MEEPFIRIEDTGELFTLRSEVTTVGRGRAVDVRLSDPSVSKLHAEIVRRGPYVYVVDLGLSRNGTRVNGRPVARRVLEEGDVVSFGTARCRVSGIPREDLASEVELRRSATPELTRRELDVLTSLCRPALSDEAFVAPATAREIAADLVVTEAAVKQHLLRLYQKFRVSEGPNRRTRLANEVVALGLVRPLPPAGGVRPEPAWSTGGPGAGTGPGGTGPGGTGAQRAGQQGAAPRATGAGGGSQPTGPPGTGPHDAGPHGSERSGSGGPADGNDPPDPPARGARSDGGSRRIRSADRVPRIARAAGRPGRVIRHRAG